jgi:hypothetical protein
MGFLFFIAIAGVVIYTWQKNARAGQDQWRAAAERLGLGYFPGDFGMVGKIAGRKGGHRVTISTFTKGGGKSSSSYTKYRVDYHEPIQVDFTITRQTALHRMGQVLGLKDIQVGDTAFDELAMVRGMHTQELLKFLDPSRRQAIMRLLSAYNDVVVTNEYIEMNRAGKDADAAIIAHVVRVLLSVCNDLTDTSSSLAEENHTIELDSWPPLSGFEPSETAVPEIEPVESSLDPFISANPVVPEPVWTEIEPGMDKEPEPPETEPLPVAAEPATGVVDLAQAAETLFGGDVGRSLVTAKVFAERFKGRAVSGTGTIKRVGRFSYDPVFTNTSGIKATVEICELAGPYSKIKVTAEVKFPPEAFEGLKSRVGMPMEVAGTLVAQDAMMNQLFVEA